MRAQWFANGAVDALAAAMHRARRDGLDFDAAWAQAVRAAMAALPSVNLTTRRSTLGALNSTRDAWRRAWEGEPPSPGEASVAALLMILRGDGADRHDFQVLA